jgi:cell division septation protein DedD
MRRNVFPLIVAVLIALPATSMAQADSARVASPASAVFARARQLVVNGAAAAGRSLVDSVLAATSPDSAEYPEGLYWRAALSASPADAERDYRRIVVEYQFSPHAGDALVQLAQLEAARGDREAAEGHLRKFLIEQPTHGQRGRAGYMLARILFDRNDLPHGCAALVKTRNDVPADSVELRNQVDYLVPRCDGVDTSGAAAARAAVDSAAAAAGRGRGSTSPARAAPAGRYTVQVAAYQTRHAADAIVKRLGADARLVGKSKPFRVRIGYFETRAAASATLRQLRAKGYKPFVTETADER